MNCERLKAIIDGQFSEWMAVKPHKMADGSEAYRVTMPLTEPNGDAITVYLTESNGRLLVEDGGHIAGLLFELSHGKPTQEHWNIIERELYYSGMKKNTATGIVYAEADESSLRYWMTELAQLIAVLPHLLPKTPVPWGYSLAEKNSTDLPKTVSEVSEKLDKCGFTDAIQFNETISGQTGIKRKVDFVYTVGQSGFGIEKAVYILAFDLNVKYPLAKASRKLVIASDLAWSTPNYSDWTVDVRLVYGLRAGTWEDAPEARLLAAAGEKSELNSYWWDDPRQQDKFLADVSKDLSV